MCGALLPWSRSWSRPWAAGWSVGEATRIGPGTGSCTVIRWVSSRPSRFQGGYCHESGVECMFPASRQSNFERLRAQVRRIVLFVRGAPCGFRLRCTLDRGGTHASVASVTRHSSRTRFHTHRKNVLVKRHAVDRGQHTVEASGIGQYRDRTVHMGRCRQEVSNMSILSFFVPIARACLFSGRLSRWTCWILGLPLKAHIARGLQQKWTEAARRGESSGQRWQ